MILDLLVILIAYGLTIAGCITLVLWVWRS